ncbi:MAG: helix-turn-helix domain-containing protein [Acidobacteriota bacterium]
MPEHPQPTREALELLARPWKPNILWYLRFESLTFSRLRRKLGGVSREVLVQHLRALERDGLVQRHPQEERLEFSLTPLASTLEPTLDRLYEWWHRHMTDVRRAQESYDQRIAPSPPPPAAGYESRP